MSFKLVTILLGFTAFLLFLLLKLLKGDAKVFVKKTNYYLLGAMLMFAVFGLFGLMLRSHDMSAATLWWLYAGWCLGLGLWHANLMFRILPWSNPGIGLLEWLFTGLIMAIGSLAFFQVCIHFEEVGRLLSVAYADNILGGIVLFPIPLLCLKAWEIWQTIPKVTVTGWTLPLDRRPPVIEPGKSVKLTFLVPAGFRSSEIIQVDMLAPIERTVGETFHFILYRHNVEKNSFKKIEIAENNLRDRAYTWLFYKKVNVWWWWTGKRYLNPDQRIRQMGLQNGEAIFVERIKHW